ncbi:MULTISPECIES: hypothetical protein [unclassified Brevibacterium]|uniref:hypothetical protein n=1 Tax=unclassified Brevibacterium TaxID=2614124 RepID=UPI0010927AA0|nr:hypothetical protein [Brevibacterium sp. S22]TGD26372.1 hypothetical protein EB835_19980 [Brevibacterium sp. S22]
MRHGTLRGGLRSPLAWDGLLGLLVLIWSFIFIRLFSPGRINVDIGYQWEQALGKTPVSDWHPPVMSAVWKVLIDLTGDPGSLLALQVLMLAVAAWLTGVLIHRRGGPRWVSLLGPAVMAAPWVLSQMTTLWKDSQMAVAMLLAVVLIAVIRFSGRSPGDGSVCGRLRSGGSLNEGRSSRLRSLALWVNVLWIPAVMLLVYAVSLRKNAVFALVPIAVYAAVCLLDVRPMKWRRWPRSKSRTALAVAGLSVLILGIVGAGSVATDAAIASRAEVKHTGQISQIFLDDVMFSVPEASLQAADAPDELKDHISTARDKCLAKGEIWDAYWNCYGRGPSGRAFSPLAHQDELKDLWLNEVITHPVRYVEYRAAVYSMYFFSSKLEYWELRWDAESEKIGYPLGSTKADYIFEPYVNDFALETFPMLFKPWFWTLIAVVLLAAVVHMRRKDARVSVTSRKVSQPLKHQAAPSRPSPHFGPEITVLTTSALCYIAGYFPIVPANHFRYTFWPAVAVTVACVLALSMWRRRGVAHDDDPAAYDPSDRSGRGDAATPPSPASSESES